MFGQQPLAVWSIAADYLVSNRYPGVRWVCHIGLWPNVRIVYGSGRDPLLDKCPWPNKASAVTLRARLDQIDFLAESGPLSPNKIEIRTNIVKDLMCLENQLIKDLKQKAKCKWAKNDITFLDRPFSNQEIKDAVWGCGGDKAPGQTVEALNMILVEAKNKNKFHGIKVGKDKTYISHLQFTDDALIIVEWSLTNAKNLSRILTYFHLASGLKGKVIRSIHGYNGGLGDPSLIKYKSGPWGIDLNSVRCLICDEDVETEEHIFVHCNLVRKIWKDVLLWWKVDNINVLSLLKAINLVDKVSLPLPLSALFDAVVQATLWAVWDCSIDKSPSPDGFTFHFYRRFWNLIENNVYDAVKYFFTYIVIPKGCNLSFIALIPKIPDANTVKDFKPISLIGSLNKIVAKILANRLVGVLGDIVNVINMSKSKIIGVLVDSDKVECAASKLGGLILKTPFSYLGSKVGGSISRVHTWNEVVDRVKNRLSKWKTKTLSIGESIRSQFFKGKELNSKKASWVNWKKVLAPKEKEGLGVSILYALNKGLMFKWMWRYYTQNTSLWVRVIKAIHGDDGKVGGYLKDGAKSCWLSIVNEINSLKNKGINLLDFMHVKLENGDKTAFWENIWIEGKALKNRQMDMGFESSGYFSVASVRKVIDDKSLAEVDSKTRWIKYAPIKVNVHAWKVKTDSLPTRQTVRMITRWWDVPYGEVDSYEDWINWLWLLMM
nr:RNA-directed DNA polymerase, eukaryota, reverse transcriptase zinc-binding domain protein [Tanacetum cinerariifolium]